MSETLLKVAPGQDLYVTWDSIVEAPTFLGTRDEVLEHYGTVEGRCPTCHSYVDHQTTTRARLDRADKRGSSSHVGDWHWDDNETIYAQAGYIQRADLPAVVELLAGGAELHDPRILALLSPLDPL